MGLEERRIHTIARRDSVLFVGTDNGVYRRDLSIESEWTSLNLEEMSVIALLLDSGAPSTLYAGIDIDQRLNPSQPSLFKSIDAGVSWFESGMGIEGSDPFSILSPPEDPSQLLVANNGRVYRSDDEGTTWIKIFGDIDGQRSFSNVSLFAAAPSNFDFLYLGGSSITGMPVMKRSFDRGESWITAIGSSFAGFVSSIAIDPRNSSTHFLYIAGGGLLKTTDDGQSYDILDPGAPAVSILNSILFDPSESDHVLIGGGEFIYESNDGGLGWRTISLPEGTSFISMIWDVSNTANVYVGTNAGVYLLELPPLPADAKDRSWVEYE